VIQLLASQKFGGAIEILQWICLGMMLRVASWPMGFILLAKGARWLFFWSELLAAAVSLGLVWLGVKYIGLNGTGMAFFGTYIFYWCVVYAIVRSLSGFRWSSANRRIGLVHALLIGVVFGASYLAHHGKLPLWLVYSGGALVTLFAAIHSAKTICSLIPLDRLPAPARRLAVLFRLTPLNQNQNIK
jgi:PST family polysaccharide transporter